MGPTIGTCAPLWRCFGEELSSWRVRLGSMKPTTVVSIKDVYRKIARGLIFLHRRGICHGRSTVVKFASVSARPRRDIEG